MRMITRALALACAMVALAACSHKDKNAPLAFVPADTPYVFANLKPLDDDAQQGLLAMLNVQLPAQVMQLRNAADELDAADKPAVARLIRAMAKELDGRTYQQIAAADGLDMHGHMAIYGLGLSPVVRADLADPGKFEALIARMEKAYGEPMTKGKVGKLGYRALPLDKSGLELVISVQDKQYVAALLPANNAAALRQALGVDRPRQNLQDSERLKKLAKERGYGPYALGYLDIQALPALLTSGKDPIVQVFMDASRHAAAAKGEPPPTLPPSCKTDFARIAARMPMLSFGYTQLDAKHTDSRVELDLADDITKTFASLKAPLPGLGTTLDAPFDLAVALPMPTIREFWTAQADAVAAKPFTCPALTDLNKGFAHIRQMLPRTTIPPLGDLRGLRVSIDAIGDAKGPGLPSIRARLLIASSNPQSLFAMAQLAVPALASIQLQDDAKPVALPAPLTAMTHQPTWAAMSKNAVAIGLGAGEDAKLAPMLAAPMGDAGALLQMHLDGALYAKWIARISDSADQAMAADPGAAPRTEKTKQSVAASMAAARAAAERVAQMSMALRMGDHGILIDSKVELH